ncbi:MAG TPA: FAD-binding oxidoreductase [Clostridiales bacterium]|nr:FAD-binding oxidoreductase [Clostridiales bacterium]
MAFPYNKLTGEDIVFLKGVTSPERVLVGEEIQREYYHDEMPEYGIFAPEVYIEAISKEEISAIMKFAYEHNIPVTARGAGTGLAGGATCKYGGIMLSVMRLNKIIKVDAGNLSMTAQPGVLLSEVAAAAIEKGMFYPPDPGEKTASIGGTVMTNAGGMRAVRYGVTRDYVRSIEAVLPDGEIVTFSSNVVKNTTGYAIKDLVIGSEGTLCIATEITLKLISIPKCSYSLVVPYNDLEKCIDTVPKLLNSTLTPTAIEFIEAELLDIVERQLGKVFPDKSGSAYLIVMIDGNTKQEVERDCDIAAEICLEAGARDVMLCNTEERNASVWSIRGAVLEGMKADTTGEEECDVVVPRSKIAEYVKAAKEIAAKHKVRIITVGHAGDGNIHTEILRDDLTEEEWKVTTDLVLKELYAKSKELGGQLSGEHGIGNGRLKYLEDFVGSRMSQLYKSIKLAFDEKNILNPGKMIEIM